MKPLFAYFCFLLKVGRPQDEALANDYRRSRRSAQSSIDDEALRVGIIRAKRGRANRRFAKPEGVCNTPEWLWRECVLSVCHAHRSTP
jgi:hypothetical protein